MASRVFEVTSYQILVSLQVIPEKQLVSHHLRN